MINWEAMGLAKMKLCQVCTEEGLLCSHGLRKGIKKDMQMV